MKVPKLCKTLVVLNGYSYFLHIAFVLHFLVSDHPLRLTELDGANLKTFPIPQFCLHPPSDPL